MKTYSIGLCLSMYMLYAIVLFACLEFYSVKGDCGAIPVYNHSSNNLTGNPPYPTDTLAEVKCNEGYARSGYRYLSCYANGIWSSRFPDNPPRCTPKSCGDPGTPQNGGKDSYVYSVGSVVRYDCDEGYELQGSTNRICLVSTVWTGSTPTCVVVTCPSLPTPANGALQVTELTYDSTIALTCDEGFTSVGPTSRVCQGDKTWSNQEFVCQEIDCGPYHGLVPNAVVEPQGGTTWGESVQITCFANATSSTAESYNIIHCNDQGVWAPEAQKCQGCCDVAEIQGDNSVPYIPNQDCLPHGTSKRSSLFTCNHGFLVSNTNMIRECTNGSLLPATTCLPIRCTIQTVNNGRVLEANRGEIVDFDSAITIECNQGYEISGLNPTQCARSTIYPTCSPAGCAVPTDFNGNIKKAGSDMIVKDSNIGHNTKLIYTCPENFVIPPDMSLSVERTCDHGILAATPSCIEAPCPVKSVSEFDSKFDSNSLASNCLHVIQGDKYIVNGCSFTMTCGEGHTVNGTCVYGTIKSSCDVPHEGLTVGEGIVIGVLVVVVLGAVAAWFGYKKVKSNKHEHKPNPEHDSQTVKLKGISSNADGKGEPV